VLGPDALCREQLFGSLAQPCLGQLDQPVGVGQFGQGDGGCRNDHVLPDAMVAEDVDLISFDQMVFVRYNQIDQFFVTETGNRAVSLHVIESDEEIAQALDDGAFVPGAVIQAGPRDVADGPVLDYGGDCTFDLFRQLLGG
jgi:hypothetical protein